MRLAAFLLAFALAAPCWALTDAAREFMEVASALEDVHCEKRKLRRRIALAEAQGEDARALKERFAALGRDPRTASLEKRLGELEPRVSASRDPEDLSAISRQHREAYIRCE